MLVNPANILPNGKDRAVNLHHKVELIMRWPVISSYPRRAWLFSLHTIVMRMAEKQESLFKHSEELGHTEQPAGIRMARKMHMWRRLVYNSRASTDGLVCGICT